MQKRKKVKNKNKSNCNNSNKTELKYHSMSGVNNCIAELNIEILLFA